VSGEQCVDAAPHRRDGKRAAVTLRGEWGEAV